MKPTAVCTALAALIMSGCQLGTGDPTNSRFSTPNSAGVIAKTDGGLRGSEASTLTGNVYGYQVGPVPNDGLQSFAGIASGASVTAPPASGSAIFEGRFEVAFIDFIFVSGDRVSGQSYFDRGAIALTADFDSGRLTGGGTGLGGGPVGISLRENELVVDGQFTGDTLTGTVTYDGVSGPLRGLVGSNEVIGAFHGHTDNQTHAGGFIAN